jgi:hypothetical protein
MAVWALYFPRKSVDSLDLKVQRLCNYGIIRTYQTAGASPYLEFRNRRPVDFLLPRNRLKRCFRELHTLHSHRLSVLIARVFDISSLDHFGH